MIFYAKKLIQKTSTFRNFSFEKFHSAISQLTDNKVYFDFHDSAFP